MALPIVGDFLTRVYADPSLGISKEDRFRRPERMPEYDCEEEMQQNEIIEDDEGFFD